MKYLTTQIKEAIRNPYVWPGGYPLYITFTDGELICPECARNNFKQICKAARAGDRRDEWCPNGTMILWEDNGETCINCYKKLESAYGGTDDAAI